MKNISIKMLYEGIGDLLSYGYIEHEFQKETNTHYYDLYDDKGHVVCMDGEECEIYFDGNLYKLINKNGEVETEFYLTKEEFEIATFK